MGSWGRVMAWTLVLFVFTCTDNLDALIWHHVVGFQWDWRGSWSDLLITSDFHYASPYFWFIKLGHFSGFAVLDILIYKATQNKRWALLVTFVIAALTEVLQLHFGRDGRLYDILIDSVGAMSAAVWFEPAIGIGIGKLALGIGKLKLK